MERCLAHHHPCVKAQSQEVVAMTLPCLSFLPPPLSSPFSPSNKLPCGQIWFNFLCPLKGNETSGGDLRESESEDMSDGIYLSVCESCSCEVSLLKSEGESYLPFSPVCVHVRICLCMVCVCVCVHAYCDCVDMYDCAWQVCIEKCLCV